jgi:hypothetical protein
MTHQQQWLQQRWQQPLLRTQHKQTAVSRKQLLWQQQLLPLILWQRQHHKQQQQVLSQW